MLNVSDATKSAYKSATAKSLTISFPNANITLTNADIVSNSLEISESIESGKNLSFKGCIASKLKFKCAAAVRDLRGEYVEVSIQAGETDVIPLFKGIVDEQTNQTHEDILTEFTAYDKLYTLGQTDVTSWYNSLFGTQGTTARTIKYIRDSLFTQLGLTQKTQTLVNDNLTVGLVETKDQLLALDVMRAICQANASYGRIGRDGKFEYVELTEITQALYPSTETFPSDQTFPSGENADIKMNPTDYIKVTYEPFRTSKISAVYLIAKDGTKTTYGSGTNVLAVTDNIIAQGCTNKSGMAQAIYGRVNRLEYTPSNVETMGFPWLECGDIYLFNTRVNIVRAYMLTRRLKGIQSLFDTYTAAGNQIRDKYKETSETKSTTREQGIQENRDDIIRTNEVVATKATIDQLNATNARVGNLEADHVSVNELNAVSGAIQSLSAIAITTQNLSAQSITANQVSAGTVNGHAVSWQKILAIGSSSWGYLYQNPATKEIVSQSSDSPPDPSWTRIGGFINGTSTKGFYTLAQDNA